MNGEKNYLIAQEEIKSDTKKNDLWVKAMTLAEGDEEKAIYQYITLRVEQLNILDSSDQATSLRVPLSENVRQIVYVGIASLLYGLIFAGQSGTKILSGYGFGFVIGTAAITFLISSLIGFGVYGIVLSLKKNKQVNLNLFLWIPFSIFVFLSILGTQIF